jgi:hypothetical protein
MIPVRRVLFSNQLTPSASARKRASIGATAIGHAKVMIDAQQLYRRNRATNMSKVKTRFAAALLLVALPSPIFAQSFDAKALSRKPEAPAPKPKDRAGGMKACPEYGAGFYRLAGSDTCVRIGGGVSTDVGTSGVLR